MKRPRKQLLVCHAINELGRECGQEFKGFTRLRTHYLNCHAKGGRVRERGEITEAKT